MAFFNEQPYTGPFPDSVYLSPGLGPLDRPVLRAPMPLASFVNSNKVIANQTTQSVAKPTLTSTEEKQPEIPEPVQESPIGPSTVVKVRNHKNNALEKQCPDTNTLVLAYKTFSARNWFVQNC